MRLESNEYLTRRASIRGSLAILLGSGSAGCLFGSSRGVSDIEIYNKTQEMAHVSVQVTSLNNEDTQFEQKISLSGETGICFNNDIVQQTNNRVKAQVADGPSKSWKWTNVHNTLHILITQNSLSHQVGERPNGVKMTGMCTDETERSTRSESEE